jgi:hypothetical protein
MKKECWICRVYLVFKRQLTESISSLYDAAEPYCLFTFYYSFLFVEEFLNG